MSAMRVSRTVAVAAGLALALSLYSCTITTDLSGAIVGKVMVAGSSTPIPGAVVECAGVAAVSAADGAYSLVGIPPGDRVVLASAEGYAGYSEVVAVEELTRHDIYMAVVIEPARMFGYVSHATLGPLEGAAVRIGDMIVVTDSLGYYEYPNLQQISYLVTVTKEGYRLFSQNVLPTSEDFQFDVSLKKLATATLWSIADAGVIEDYPNTNYGDDPGLRLFYNEFYHERFYISFSLNGIEATAEPSAATLRLYNTWEESGEEPRAILVASLIDPWQELEVTWADTAQTTGGAIAHSTYEDRWYEVDVEIYFSDWLTGGEENFGLLVDTPMDDVAGRFIFASREYEEEDKRAHVVLDYAW